MADNQDEDVVMEGESIVALYGEVGAGKTNRLVEQLLDELRRGSYCIWVDTATQKLNVEAVASYLGDATVHNRLVCITAADILKPGFWPEERHALSTQWKDAVFRAGTRMFWDEAWDLLDVNVEIEEPDPKRPGEVRHTKFLKTEVGRKVKLMLRKLRHWKGPMDYRDPRTLAAVADPTWSPMKSEAEQDGIEMISCGVMLATQQYMALDIEIRRSVQAILYLRTYGSSFKNKLLGVLADKYRELYQKGNVAPKKIDILDNDPTKKWSIRPHIPEVHALTDKVRGNERSMLSRLAKTQRSPGAYLKAGAAILFAGVLLYCLVSLVYTFFFKEDEKPPSKASQGVSSSSRTQSSVKGEKAPQAGPTPRILGRVGSQIMLTDGRNTWFVPVAGFVKSENGYVGKVDGVEVSSWSAPIVGAPVAGDGAKEKPLNYTAVPSIF